MILYFEQIELQAKLLNYFLGSNKSKINQNTRGGVKVMKFWIVRLLKMLIFGRFKHRNNSFKILANTFSDSLAAILTQLTTANFFFQQDSWLPSRSHNCAHNPHGFFPFRSHFSLRERTPLVRVDLNSFFFGFESRVFIENWWWVSQGCGRFFSFTMANPRSSLRFNTHWSAPLVSGVILLGYRQTKLLIAPWLRYSLFCTNLTAQEVEFEVDNVDSNWWRRVRNNSC